MSFIKVANTNEVIPGILKAVEINSTQILLVNLAGNYFALGNICKHRGCPLSAGILRGEVIECACHGSQYNVKTGVIVRGPTKEPESSYEVKVENDQILIKI